MKRLTLLLWLLCCCWTAALAQVQEVFLDDHYEICQNSIWQSEFIPGIGHQAGTYGPVPNGPGGAPVYIGEHGYAFTTPDNGPNATQYVTGAIVWFTPDIQVVGQPDVFSLNLYVDFFGTGDWTLLGTEDFTLAEVIANGGGVPPSPGQTTPYQYTGNRIDFTVAGEPDFPGYDVGPGIALMLTISTKTPNSDDIVSFYFTNPDSSEPVCGEHNWVVSVVDDATDGFLSWDTENNFFADEAGTQDSLGNPMIIPILDVANCALEVLVDGAPINCNGGTTDLLLTFTNGDGPYEDFTLFDEGGNPVFGPVTISEGNTLDLLGVPAGDYTFTLTYNAGGCEAQGGITVDQPEQLQVDFSIAGADLTITAQGGTPVYTYSVFPFGGTPAVTNGTGVFPGLPAGDHQFSVTDANGCEVGPIDFTIEILCSIEITNPIITDAPCNGGEGSIVVDLLVEGGSSTFEISVNGSPFFPAPAGPSLLPAGDYEIIVRDASFDDCRDTINFTIDEPEAINADMASSTNPTNGQANGSFDLDATGGVGPYTYTLANPSVSNATGVFTGLGEGTYDVTITDANGCEFFASVELVNENTCDINITALDVTDAPCFGENGSVSADLEVTSTSDEYEVSFNGGPFQPAGFGATSLPAGNYEVIVRDANFIFCADTATFTINEPAPLTADAGQDLTVCPGETFSLSASASDPSSTFAWTGSGGGLSTPNAGTTDGVLNNVGTFTYTVTATTGAGCTATDQVTVTVANNLTANAGQDITVCAGQTFTLSATASDPSATFAWTGAGGGLATPDAATTDGVLNNVGTFIYTVTATTDAGCTATDQVRVTVTTAPTAPQIVAVGGVTEITPTEPAILQANVNPGTTVEWYLDGGTTAVATGTEVSFDVVGCYTARIITASCPSGISNEICLTAAEVPDTFTYCVGDPCVDLVASNGACTDYRWRPTLGLNVTDEFRVCARPRRTTTYTVTYNCDGVEVEELFVVRVGQRPTAVITPLGDLEFCQGQSVTLQAYSETGYFHQWYRNGHSIDDATSDSYVATESGIYEVGVTDTESGCSRTSLGVSVIVNPGPAINAIGDQDICEGQSAQLDIIGATFGVTYLWEPADGLTSTTIRNPIATPTQSTVYTVTVTNGNCSSTDTVSVEVLINGFELNPTCGPSPVTLCENQCCTIGTDLVGSFVYDWEYSADNTVFTSLGLVPSATLNVCGDSFESGWYRLRVTSITCPGVVSEAYEIIFNPGPDITDIASTPNAPGFDLTVTASGNGLTYDWQPAGLIVAGQGTATATTDVLTEATTFTVTVTDAGGCSDDTTIVVSPCPTELVLESDLPAVCGDGCVTLTATPVWPNASFIDWYRDGVLFITTLPTENTLTVCGVEAVGDWDGRVNADGCDEVTSNTITITQSTPPVVSIPLAPAIVCPGDDFQLDVDVTDATTYTVQWTPVNGLDNPASETPIWDPADVTTTFTVTVTAAGCDPVTATYTLEVLDSETAGITPAGPITSCEPVVLTASPSAATYPNVTYQWYLASVALAGETAETLSANAEGDYTVEVFVNGDCSDLSDAVTFDFAAAPVAEVTVLGGSIIPICATSSDILLEATPVAGATYNWEMSSACDGAWMPTGVTTETYNVAAAGCYRLIVTNDLGCADTSDVVTITVGPNPYTFNPDGTVGVPATSCGGTDGILVVDVNRDGTPYTSEATIIFFNPSCMGGPFSYDVSEFPAFIDQSVTGEAICLGCYDVTIEFPDGCSIDTTICVSEPAECCPTPTNLTADGITFNSFDVTWDNILGVSGFEYSFENGPWTQATGTSASFDFLSPNTTYTVCVRTECVEDLLWSNEVCIDVTTEECGLPTNIAAINVTASSVTIDWDAAPNALGGYEIEYVQSDDATPPANGYTGADVILPPTTQYTIDENSALWSVLQLEPETCYWVRLYTSCDIDNGVYSDYVYVNFCTPAVATECLADVPVLEGVTDITTNGATVTWGDAAGADGGYLVQLQDISGNNIGAPSASPTPSIVLTGLDPNTTYQAQIFSVCADGTPTIGFEIALFTTLPLASCDAETPVLDQVTNISQASATVIWTAANGAASYRVVIRDVATLATEEFTTTETQIIFTGLEAGTTYEVEIYSVCADGSDGVGFESTTFTTLPLGTCLAESPVLTGVSGITTTTATISWEIADGADRYLLTLTNLTDGSTQEFITDQTFLVLTNLVPGTSYEIQLLSECADGTDGLGFDATVFSTQTEVFVCETPVLTILTLSGPTTIFVEWLPVDGAAAYQVEYRLVGAPTFTTFEVTGTNTEIEGLLADSDYEVRVRTRCDDGSFSGYDGDVVSTVSPGCNAPSTVSVAGASVTSSSATVTWTAVPNAIGYLVEFTRIFQNQWDLNPSFEVTGTSVTITGLTASTSYEVRVSALCAGNQQSPYRFGGFTTRTTCNIPTDATAEVNGTDVTFTWTAAGGAATSYRIRYRQVGTATYSTQTTVATSVTIGGFTPGVTYEWNVQTICGASSQSDYTATQEFIIGVGGREAGNKPTMVLEAFSVYPNPNNGTFTVAFTALTEGSVQLRVVEMTGRMILEASYNALAGDNEVPVQLDEMAKGVYMLQLQQGTEVRTAKLVVR